MKNFLAFSAMFGLLTAGGLAADSAQAREAHQIYGPIFEQYKSITDARKKLRNKEKKGQAMSGDEYFAMAVACGYEAPESASMILTALSRSRCKDKVTSYYLEAGRRGIPEGFLAAAMAEANGNDAFGFAQLAYQLSGEDAALRSDALELMADLQPRVSDPANANAQAMQISQQLVAAGSYPSFRNPAGAKELASLPPRLDWLNFVNSRRCEWSEPALAVMDGAYRWVEGSRGSSLMPAKVKVPGIAAPVRGRITRPEKSAPNIVVSFVDFKGRWKGLTVLGLTDAFIEQGDGVWGKGIRFAEPVSEVAQKLSAAGFIVNTDGSRREQAGRIENIRYTDDRGRIQTMRQMDGVETTIERSGSETVFLCNQVFELGMG